MLDITKKIKLDKVRLNGSTNYRSLFTTQYPEDSLSHLNLNDYCLRGKDNNFCYMLEYDTRLMGIKGGNAYKHGLYKDNTGQFKSSKSKSIVSLEVANSELVEILDFINSTLSLVRDNNIESILKRKSSPIWRMVLSKIISIYAPEHFINIAKNDYLYQFCLDHGIDESDIYNQNLISLNLQALQLAKSIDHYKSLKPDELGYYIWNYYDNVDGIQHDNIDRTKVSLSIPQNDRSPAPPLNQILYGPPGTGKTYNTISMAVDIIDGEDSERNYEKSRKRYHELREEGRIKFVTFHQNYSYEDFVEGLRPIPGGDKGLAFDNQSGIFKKLCRDAKTEIDKPSKISFEEAFEGLLCDILDGSIEEYEVPMTRVSYHITDINDISIGFRKSSGGTAHRLSISKLNDMYNTEEYIKEPGGLKGYYNGLLSILLEYGKNTVSIVDEEIDSDEPSNFVLIIDEINRANISRVFGELITLIEPDKRAGNENAMSVTLPSGDSFSVPNNLYIIGTMNTADKSIALLDIALRRRFEFVPMYPQYKINGAEIHESDFLKKLNTAISENESLGRDLQIGHSYFMGGGFNFYTTLKNKVVPLLLEYTMNDEGMVVGLLESSLDVSLHSYIDNLMPWNILNTEIEAKFNGADTDE